MKKTFNLLLLIACMFFLVSCVVPGTQAHVHDFTGKYLVKGTEHYVLCSCGEIGNVGYHKPLYEGNQEANKCSTCGCIYTDNDSYLNIASLGVDKNEVHNAYEVLIYSFYDSDYDGYGDLAGLESKLPYLNDLGVDILWLSPIMEAESYHGYDIKSFYNIDPKLGTIDDYLSLVNSAHELNIKIMLDMPINHTSINHEWFLEYINGNSDYSEYYQEYNSSISYGNSSSMGAKAKFYEQNGKSYFSAFGPEMADLNYQSSTLIDAVYDVFEYWMALGADGFRFDAVKHIYDINEISSSENSLERNKTFFENLKTHLKDINPNVYLLGENFSGQPEVLQYATSFDAEFDFESWHIALGAVTNNDPWGGEERRKWYDDTVVGCTNELLQANYDWIPTFMTGNHDVTRAASYIGDKVGDDDKALKLYAAMTMLRQGIPFIYYGDEIGMYGENKVAYNPSVGDSEVRLPMNFQDTTVDVNSVFYSFGDDKSATLGENISKDWPTFKTDNPVVEEQMYDTDSLYNTYKELIELRKSCPTLALGNMTVVSDYYNEATVYKMEYNGDTVYVAFNFSERVIKIDNMSSTGDLSIVHYVNDVDTDGSMLKLGARGVAVFRTSGTVRESINETLSNNNQYQLIINDSIYVDLEFIGPWSYDNTFVEYKALGVELSAGDIITLYDVSYDAGWVLTKIDPYSAGKMTASDAGIVVGEDGKYDIYVKMKYEQDNIYFGKSQ